jgi:peptidoglycan/xylan/chitin deacetylase (PgdA/CDA1 family)
VTPARTEGSFRFGRLAAGPAWPAGLASLDRFAPVPEAASAPAEGEAVLVFAEAGEPPRPLCARDPGGGVAWSIDPAAWIRAILDEDYVRDWKRPLPSRLPFVNYSRAPFAVKRVLARLQDPSREASPPDAPFPELPLDDFVDALRALCARLEPEGGPADEAWPGGARAAVAVTYDVDSSWILDPARADLLARIVDEESELGFPGAWYVVADELRLPAHEPALRRIRDAGHEVGSHGFCHDGRLQYLSPARQEERMAKVMERMAGLGVRGMRTPWYARSRGLFEAIARHFEYDSSVPNASGFFSSRTRSGCCTVFPYQAAPGIVEIPMTLPPDTAVPVERRRRVLGEIADAVVARGGLVVVTLHPQPHQSANEAGLASHLGLLRDLRERHGGRLWCATPAEVAEWYRTQDRCGSRVAR